MQKNKHLLTLLIISIATLSGCFNRTKHHQKKQALQSIQVRGFSTSAPAENGVLRCSLYAEKASLNQENGNATCTTLSGTVQGTKSPPITIKAPQAYWQHQRKVLVIGETITTESPTWKITTKHGCYNANTGMLVFPEPVACKHLSGSIQSSHSFFNARKHQLSLVGSVTSTIEY